MSAQEVIIKGIFKAAVKSPINLGTSNYRHWIKLRIKNNTPAHCLLLQVDNAMIDELVLYKITTKRSIEIAKSGLTANYHKRKYRHPRIVLELTINPGDEQEFLISLKSTKPLFIPLTLSDTKSTYESLLQQDALFGIYFGIIFIMFFYNLFIYFTIRDAIYLKYLAYLFSVEMVQLAISGYTHAYLWPQKPWLSTYDFYIAVPLSGITIVEFMRHYMKVTGTISPLIKKFLNGSNMLYASTFISTLFGYTYYSNIIFDFCGVFMGFWFLIILANLAIKKTPSATYLLLGWSTFLFGVIIYSCRNLGLLPANNFTNYTMAFGNAIETLFLSFSLANRINLLKKEREKSQTALLKVSYENENLIKDQNILLEQTVEKRTKELQESHIQLKETYQNLKTARSKMETLGQVTAGIAHDIASPLSQIALSTTIVESELKLANIPTDKKEKMNALLATIQSSSEFVLEVSGRLRTYSLNQSDNNLFAPYESVQESCKILSYSLKNMQVSINLDNEVLIKGNKSRLTQLFMNVINNATQAIRACEVAGNITVSDKKEANFYEMQVVDNGIGLSDKDKGFVFDSFFTTKASGNGIGLHEAQTIAREMNAEVSLENNYEGRGCTFSIKFITIN